MADPIRTAVRLAVAAAVAVSVMAVTVSLVQEQDPAASPLFTVGEDWTRAANDEPMRLSDMPPGTPAVHYGIWDDSAVIVLRLEVSLLEAASVDAGINTGAFATQDPEDPAHALVAYSAKSTVLGCIVQLHHGVDTILAGRDQNGDGVRDGYLWDPCHMEGHWDPYRLGEPVGQGHGGLEGLPVMQPVIVDGQALYIQEQISYEEALDQASKEPGFNLPGR